MKLSKLLELVGDDNLKFQMLHESVSNVSENKRRGKITFLTEKMNSQGLMNQITTGTKPQFTGMVVWIPTEKMDKVIKENDKPISLTSNSKPWWVRDNATPMGEP